MRSFIDYKTLKEYLNSREIESIENQDNCDEGSNTYHEEIGVQDTLDLIRGFIYTERVENKT
jgi:hypothetical protein